ncbi:MAG: hypothetical protein VX640_02735 [Pseudomonadota bacterium]|nr:hypothetical protein [Pseudomonadota bacterium]
MKPIVNLPAPQRIDRPARLTAKRAAPVAPAARTAPAATRPPLLEARPAPRGERLASTAMATQAYRATGELDALTSAPRFNVLL